MCKNICPIGTRRVHSGFLYEKFDCQRWARKSEYKDPVTESIFSFLDQYAGLIFDISKVKKEDISTIHEIIQPALNMAADYMAAQPKPAPLYFGVDYANGTDKTVCLDSREIK